MQHGTVRSAAAGGVLAEELSALPVSEAVIVALSPQCVATAFDAARRLGWELDLLLIGRISAPGHPERTIGSVLDLDVPQMTVDEKLARECHVPPGYLDTERHRQLAELERLHFMYLGDDDGARHHHAGKDVVLIDDGVEPAILQQILRALSGAGAVSVRIVAARPGDGRKIDERAVAQLLKEARRIHRLLH